ncbi:MAG: glycosyltransferase family 2 protein [Pseudomonadota bacterium]
MKTISLVIPCYNEQEVLAELFAKLEEITKELSSYKFELVFVNDGSRDNTQSILNDYLSTNPDAKIVEFSRNFGKEPAMSAGLEHASGDAVIPIDADLQDPPELIAQMIEKWEQGAMVVLARRANRSSDTFMKRLTASLFYKLHNQMASVKIPENVGDFRLMDRDVVDAINQLPERLRFMKGLFAWVGYDAVTIDYVRAERSAGDTKFSGSKLWNFALEGITSFSAMPLKIWTYFGIVVALSCLGYAIYTLIATLIFGIDVPGYASLLIFVLFFGSMNMIGVGIIGEYIGRIYLETKARPLYIVKKLHQSGED